MTFNQVFGSSQSTILDQMANHLTFKQINHFGFISRRELINAKIMKEKKFKSAFCGSSRPLEELTGCNSLIPFFRLLNQCTPTSIHHITFLNLSNLFPTIGEIKTLIQFCKHIKHIEFAANQTIDQEILESILQRPKCKRIHLFYDSIRHVPIKYYAKVVGITLKPNNNQCLRDQIQQITALFPNLYSITIQNGNITQIPELPDSIKELAIHCESLKILSSLPIQLKSLNISGCSIEKLPALPPSLQRMEAKGCPLPQDFHTNLQSIVKI